VELQSLYVLLVALALDAAIGDPNWLWRRLSHPVVFMGGLIGFFDACWNRPELSFRRRKMFGVLALAAMIAAAALAGWVISALGRSFMGGFFIEALIASFFLAQRSLYEHVAYVGKALKESLGAGRRAVSRIVGRNTQRLDEPAICRAAIESCAENFSDGIVAPAFYLALFGLPGLFIYKMVNTADSMIGHRTERHAAFGWASARFDDVLNFLPSRLAGWLLAMSAPFVNGSTRKAFATMIGEAHWHRSPNAGWPESAAAGALDVALLGPRLYEDHEVDDPFFNASGRVAQQADIARMLRLLIVACVLEFLIYLAIALALW